MAKIKNKNNKLVLLDAYAIIHRAYHALPNFSSQTGEPTGALYGIAAMLLKILKDLKPDYLVACYDLPEKTYRHQLYDNYKAGRLKPEDDLIQQIDRSRDLFRVFNIPIYEKAGFEADDILGTITEQLKDKEIDIVIASGDMDTLQLVNGKKVQVYTLKKGINDTILYDETKVLERFGFVPRLLVDYKGLRGDPSDNIIGIKGIGEKTASVLIQKFNSLENVYQQLDTDESVVAEVVKPRVISLLKDNREEAFFSKELATIRRDVPIKFVLPQHHWRKKVKLEDILALFQEFNFRTLSQRVKDFFSENSNLKETDGDGVIEDLESSSKKKELQEILIGLWLLNSNLTKPTLEDLLSFSGKRTFQVASDFVLEEIKAKKLEFVFYEIEIPLMVVIEEMNKRGIKLNLSFLQKISQEYHQELTRLEEYIWKYSQTEFNLNSPKQLAKFLFEELQLKPKGQRKTTSGNFSTKESELQKMFNLHPVIKSILRYRELQKLLSTYIDNLPKLTDGNGKIHTVFSQTGTTTGRLSSANPNLQNIPIKSELGKKIRTAFIADIGFELVALDYSQIELRVAAVLSGDEKMIKIFKQGQDVHTAVAAEIFNVDLNQVNETMRRKAKVVNFGILYGMGVNALRKNLEEASDGVEEIKRVDAQKFYNSYFDKFKQLAEYLENAKQQVRQLGYTKTLFGRIRYFEGVRSSLPYVRAMAERMAINAPIQGTSADLIKLAMVKIERYLSAENLKDKVRLLLQVHDELIFEVKKDVEPEVIFEIKTIMESLLPITKTKGIIFAVSLKKGKNWNSLTPFP